VVNEDRTIRSGETPGPLAWSLLAGFLAWALDLGFSYTLQRHACVAGQTFWIHVVTAICFAIALSGLVAGVRELRMLPKDSFEEGRRPRDRAYFQGLLGIGFSLSFAVVVIAGAVPRWILSACD